MPAHRVIGETGDPTAGLSPQGSRTKNRDTFTSEALKNAIQNIFRELS
jgi:hypothetical protein